MPDASRSVVHLLACGQVFISCTWHYLLIQLGVPGLFNPLRFFKQKCTLVYVASLKNLFWLCSVFIMHDSGHTLWYGNCHSRTSRTRQYLFRSQVLYGSTLNTDFLFNNKYWHALDLRYKRNLQSCIWSVLNTLKVMLSRTW